MVMEVNGDVNQEKCTNGVYQWGVPMGCPTGVGRGCLPTPTVFRLA